MEHVITKATKPTPTLGNQTGRSFLAYLFECDVSAILIQIFDN